MNREKNDAVKPPKKERRQSAKEHHDRRWLFIVVDVVLLAAIVGAIIFLVSLISPKPLFAGGGKEERRLTYTVELSGIEKGSLEALKVGDTVIDRESGAVIGTVSEVASRAYEIYTDVPEKDAELGSDVVKKSTYPDDLCTVTLTLVVEADYEASVGYSVDGCRIAVGRTYLLGLPSFVGEGVCVEFRAE